jgi:outer membrane protein insertion porin family
VCAAGLLLAINTAVALGQEKRIAEVRLVGCKTVKEADVAAKVGIKAGDAYDADAIERARQNVLATGQFTEVTVGEEETPQGVVLTFNVTERLRIADIEILGAKTVSRDVVLDAIQTAGVKVGDEYDPRRVEAARKNVFALGYYTDVRVTPEDTPAGTRLTFAVDEKERIKQIRFLGNTVVSDEELLEQMVLQPGMIADNAAIRGDMARVQSYYQKRGYDAFVVNRRLEFGELEVVISERRVREIRVEGLRKTKPYVITREMHIKENDLFNENDVADDLRRVVNLQLFDSVAWDLRDDTADPQRYVILVITVKEKRTGMMMFGGGWSSLEGLIGRVQLSESNLLGTGKKGSVLTEFGGRTSYMATYTDPWLDPKRTSLSVSAFDIERRRRFAGSGGLDVGEAGRFDERRSGGSLTVGRPVARDLSLLVGFRVEDISEAFLETYRPLGDLGFGDYPTAVLPATADGRQGGSSLPPGGAPGPIFIGAPLHKGGDLRALSLTAINDRRDLYDDPTGGYWLGAGTEVSGSFLGGGADFRKLWGDVRYYKKVSQRKERVLAARLKAGTTLGDLPVFEAFIVGGADSLRGYREDRFWGRNMLLMNAELREPITESLTAVVFADAGSAWEGDFQTGFPGFTIDAPDEEMQIRVSVGAGVRVKTPFGPLRFDWGQGQEGGRFHFGFGHIF